LIPPEDTNNPPPKVVNPVTPNVLLNVVAPFTLKAPVVVNVPDVLSTILLV
jgi:hypothetical protein